eukprot:6329666-Pyramimonas_sp.AAC.1
MEDGPFSKSSFRLRAAQFRFECRSSCKDLHCRSPQTCCPARCRVAGTQSSRCFAVLKSQE